MKRLPVWALPPMALVIALAVLGFPLQWAWERIQAARNGLKPSERIP